MLIRRVEILCVVEQNLTLSSDAMTKNEIYNHEILDACSILYEKVRFCEQASNILIHNLI